MTSTFVPSSPSPSDSLSASVSASALSNGSSEISSEHSSFEATPYRVRNPRTGQYDAEFTTLSSSELEQKSQDLRSAQSLWNTQGVQERAKIFLHWHAEVVKTRSDLIDALTLDTGRYHESVLEVDLLIQSIETWAKQAPAFFESQSSEPQPSNIPWIVQHSQPVPYSLVGVISPWNFPLLLACIDALPALMAGCAVLLKPSEITPRFIDPLLQSLNAVEALKSVLGIVKGGAEVGQAVVNCVDLVCFTGSVPTGKKVAQGCSRRLIPASLELGGKDPAILLPQTDLERVLPALVWGSMVNAGQSCLSIERLYVHHSQFEQALEILTRLIGALTLNDQDLQQGQIGPIIAERQAEIHRLHLQDALDLGARIHVGGRVEHRGGGLYCLPTLLSNVSHKMKVMTEESFGPLLPVMAYQEIEQAIKWANSTQYGLSGAILGPSEEEALKWASFLECGAISVNDAALTSVVHGAEKQAFKSSGLGGSRMGMASMKRFFRSRAFLINRASHPNPWWF